MYSVPYQHFTNSIENYFSMLKSRLQKLDGLTHEKLKENITTVIRGIQFISHGIWCNWILLSK